MAQVGPSGKAWQQCHGSAQLAPVRNWKRWGRTTSPGPSDRPRNSRSGQSLGANRARSSPTGQSYVAVRGHPIAHGEHSGSEEWPLPVPSGAGPGNRGWRRASAPTLAWGEWAAAKPQHGDLAATAQPGIAQDMLDCVRAESPLAVDPLFAWGLHSTCRSELRLEHTSKDVVAASAMTAPPLAGVQPHAPHAAGGSP